jgi:hypothetical protein
MSSEERIPLDTHEASGPWSRPVYLHFIDRELLLNLGIYGRLPLNGVLADCASILFLSYEPLYFSLAMAFENLYAGALMRRYPALLRTGHIQLAIRENCLPEFVLSKQEQYEHVKNRYGFYYDDTWLQIADMGPTFVHKEFDTGSALEIELSSAWRSSGWADLQAEIRAQSLQLTPRLEDALLERRFRAITKDLFAPIYSDRQVSSGLQYYFNLLISHGYIKTYLQQYGGTLATGLASGIERFRYLCPTFPCHHIPIWRQVYGRLGVLGMIREASEEQIAAIREDPVFVSFVDSVRVAIVKAFLSVSGEDVGGQLSRVAQELSDVCLSIVLPQSRPRGTEEVLRTLERAVVSFSSWSSDNMVTRK